MADDKKTGPSEESKEEPTQAKQAATAAGESNNEAKELVQEADAALKK